MKVIRVFDVLLQYVFIFAFAACLVAGVFAEKYFILAGVALVCYILWGVWRLRCPWCRGSVELGALLKGIRRTCNCPSCGHEITVVWRVNRGVPKKLRAQRQRAGSFAGPEKADSAPAASVDVPASPATAAQRAEAPADSKEGDKEQREITV